MKKWLRRCAITAAVLGLTLAILYESATQVGRGWLRGEAFYEGRPTSWWRLRIDEWTERFDDAKEPLFSMEGIIIVPKPDRDDVRGGSAMMVAMPRPRSENWATRAHDLLRSKEAKWLDDAPPRVLWGGHGAQEVLAELAADARYVALANRGLENHEYLRSIESGGKESASYFTPLVHLQFIRRARPSH